MQQKFLYTILCFFYQDCKYNFIIEDLTIFSIHNIYNIHNIYKIIFKLVTLSIILFVEFS